MVGKRDLPKITVKYDGLFDFDGLYEAVVDWAKNYGYKWHESDFKHKVPSPRGAEHEFKWVLEKKVTGFIQYNIILAFLLRDMIEVEVEVGGSKRKLTQARISVIIDGNLAYDWQGRFSGNKFAEKLGLWYSKIMMGDIETKYLDPLYYRIWGLHSLIKKYFDMQTKKFAYKRYLGEN